jgi:hypothetical protein
LNWFPDGVDPDVPSVDRAYDYLLQGGHSFPADRQLAEQIMTMLPGTEQIVLMARALLRRVVLFMISAGVRQFLNIGSGVPSVGNAHEIAQRANPEARIVYVDSNPVAVANTNQLLAGNSQAVAIQGDLAEPDGILGHQDARRVLDFTQPIGLLLLRALNLISDDRNPNRLLAHYRQALASGSYFALSSVAAEAQPAEIKAVLDMIKGTPNEFYPRTRERFTSFFEGLDLVEPGVVPFPLWRPDSHADFADGPERDQLLIGVGRKP